MDKQLAVPYPDIGPDRVTAMNLWNCQNFLNITNIREKDFALARSLIIKKANQILYKKAYVSEIQKYLENIKAKKNKNIISRLLKKRQNYIDPVFRSILESYGIWADGAYALTLMSGGRISILINPNEPVETVLGSTRLFSICFHSRDLNWISLGQQDITWREDELSMPYIPESLQLGLARKPLSSLISHPGLDKFNITINSIIYDPDWPGTVSVITDHH